MQFLVRIDRNRSQYHISIQVDYHTTWRQVSWNIEVIESCYDYTPSYLQQLHFLITEMKQQANSRKYGLIN